MLFCTDVAARGLDFPSVSCIMQYDAAGEPSEYVHRVGRTARMGHHGESLLFLLPSEGEYVDLLATLGVNVKKEGLPGLLRCLPGAAGAVGGMGRGKKGRGRWEVGEEEEGGEYAGVAMDVQRGLVRRVGGDAHLKELAQAAFR